MANTCLKLCEHAQRVPHRHRGEQADGVAKKQAQHADVKQHAAQAQAAAMKSWLDSLFQLYCSRSKRIRLPSKKTLSAMYG